VGGDKEGRQGEAGLPRVAETPAKKRLVWQASGKGEWGSAGTFTLQQKKCRNGFGRGSSKKKEGRGEEKHECREGTKAKNGSRNLFGLEKDEAVGYATVVGHVSS